MATLCLMCVGTLAIIYTANSIAPCPAATDNHSNNSERDPLDEMLELAKQYKYDEVIELGKVLLQDAGPVRRDHVIMRLQTPGLRMRILKDKEASYRYYLTVRNAIPSVSESENFRSNMVVASLKLDSDEVTIQEHKKFINDFPKGHGTLSFQNGLGTLYLNRGDLENARYWWNQTVQKGKPDDPSVENARKNLEHLKNRERLQTRMPGSACATAVDP